MESAGLKKEPQTVNSHQLRDLAYDMALLINLSRVRMQVCRNKSRSKVPQTSATQELTKRWLAPAENLRYPHKFPAARPVHLHLKDARTCGRERTMTYVQEIIASRLLWIRSYSSRYSIPQHRSLQVWPLPSYCKINLVLTSLIQDSSSGVINRPIKKTLVE